MIYLTLFGTGRIIFGDFLIGLAMLAAAASAPGSFSGTWREEDGDAGR